MTFAGFGTTAADFGNLGLLGGGLAAGAGSPFAGATSFPFSAGGFPSGGIATGAVTPAGPGALGFGGAPTAFGLGDASAGLAFGGASLGHAAFGDASALSPFGGASAAPFGGAFRFNGPSGAFAFGGAAGSPPVGAPRAMPAFGAPAFGAAAPAPSGGGAGQAVGADGLVPHQEGETNVPTLTYFGTYGLAQTIRLIFVEAGAHFHEREIDNKEDWQDLKARLPWGQLPVLEIDGLVLSQSVAIIRYLGRKFNLAGRTSAEQAEVDAVIEAVKDTMAAFPLRPVFMAVIAGEDPVAAVAPNVENLRKHLVKFERYLQQKVMESGTPDNAPLFFVGNSLTIADLHVYSLLHLVATLAGEHGAFENLPLLQRALDSTFHRPNVQAFLEGDRAFPMIPSGEKVKELFTTTS